MVMRPPPCSRTWQVDDFPKPRRRSYKPWHWHAYRMINGLRTDPDRGAATNDSDDFEHDLEAMVKDFIENGYSDHRKGSIEPVMNRPDGDQEEEENKQKLQSLLSMSESERSLLTTVESAVASIAWDDIGNGARNCNGACIKNAIVRHLILAGHNASVCRSKWRVNGKLPAGRYEYIEVLVRSDEEEEEEEEEEERFIVDTDFRTQFRIARAVVSYEEMLNQISPIFAGKPDRLARLIEFMSGAAIASLKKSSMSVPPWRTLEYMRAKWFSNSTRITVPASDGVVLLKEPHARIHECKEHLQFLRKDHKEIKKGHVSGATANQPTPQPSHEQNSSV